VLAATIARSVFVVIPGVSMILAVGLLLALLLGNLDHTPPPPKIIKSRAGVTSVTGKDPRVKDFTTTLTALTKNPSAVKGVAVDESEYHLTGTTAFGVLSVFWC
jgi:hypothetical protein